MVRVICEQSHSDMKNNVLKFLKSLKIPTGYLEVVIRRMKTIQKPQTYDDPQNNTHKTNTLQ